MKSPFRYFNSSPEVIRLTVMMYIRYPLSLRQVEDLLFERGFDICHETPGPQGCSEVYQARDETLRPAVVDRDGPASFLQCRNEGTWNR
jgi:putative transposase